jgi:cytochrome c oxidase subunit 2
MWDFRLFPEQASTVAAEVDTLFLSLLGISGFMVLLLAALIIAFSVKYRKGTKAVHVRRLGEARWLEYTWTLIPFFIFLGLFIWANQLYVTLLQPPPAPWRSRPSASSGCGNSSTRTASAKSMNSMSLWDRRSRSL